MNRGAKTKQGDHAASQKRGKVLACALPRLAARMARPPLEPKDAGRMVVNSKSQERICLPRVMQCWIASRTVQFLGSTDCHLPIGATPTQGTLKGLNGVGDVLAAIGEATFSGSGWATIHPLPRPGSNLGSGTRSPRKRSSWSGWVRLGWWLAEPGAQVQRARRAHDAQERGADFYDMTPAPAAVPGWPSGLFCRRAARQSSRSIWPSAR